VTLFIYTDLEVKHTFSDDKDWIRTFIFSL